MLHSVVLSARGIRSSSPMASGDEEEDNGRITGDESGKCTCFVNGGSSLVDYMVASPTLFDCATSLVVHKCPLFYGKGGEQQQGGKGFVMSLLMYEEEF